MHPTKRVQVGDQEAEIDVRIADLVAAIWKKGIRTTYSCQDRGGEAWLQMPNLEYVKLNELVGDLIRSEYHGPAGAWDTRDTNVYFQLNDTPKLVARLV